MEHSAEVVHTQPQAGLFSAMPDRVGRALQDTVRLRLEIVLDCEPAAVAGQAVNRHPWSLPSATASLLIGTVKEILRDKHIQLRITAFLLLLVSF